VSGPPALARNGRVSRERYTIHKLTHNVIGAFLFYYVLSHRQYQTVLIHVNLHRDQSTTRDHAPPNTNAPSDRKKGFDTPGGFNAFHGPLHFVKR